MPVEKDINLDKPISEEDIKQMEAEADRLEEIAKNAQADSEKAGNLLSNEDKLLADAVKKVEQIEKEAEKAEKARTRIGKTITEVNQLAEYRSALANFGGTENFEEGEGRGFEALGGRDAFTGKLKTGRTGFGTGQEKSPMGTIIQLQAQLEEAEKMAETRKKEVNKKLAEQAKALAEQKGIVSSMQKDFNEVLSFTRNPMGLITGKLTGFLGGAGVAGLIAVISLAVADQIFEMVKKEFGPGGRFDVRKEMLDRDREISEMEDILDRRAGRVFFTSDNELTQGAPQFSNTERLRDRSIRYQALHLGE